MTLLTIELQSYMRVRASYPQDISKLSGRYKKDAENCEYYIRDIRGKLNVLEAQNRNEIAKATADLEIQERKARMISRKSCTSLSFYIARYRLPLSIELIKELSLPVETPEVCPEHLKDLEPKVAEKHIAAYEKKIAINFIYILSARRGISVSKKLLSTLSLEELICELNGLIHHLAEQRSAEQRSAEQRIAEQRSAQSIMYV